MVAAATASPRLESASPPIIPSRERLLTGGRALTAALLLLLLLGALGAPEVKGSALGPHVRELAVACMPTTQIDALL